MKCLYLDCSMGAAGDMLTAALLELHPEPEAFLRRFHALGIPGVTLRTERVSRRGLIGTRACVSVGGAEEGEEAHPHRHLRDLRSLIDSLAADEAFRAELLEIYEDIARAEGKIHGVETEEVHFHEVGALDAVADIAAVCLLLRELRPDRICASAISVGSGTVRCAHGLLPVPAPATAELLKGLPICAGPERGELCTPTGAALLRHFARDFGELPAMRLTAVGCGMGKKDFERPNVLRAFWGETQETGSERVLELQCNVDDMSGEEIAFACERLLEAGALDAATQPLGMKKGRPGTLIRVLCRPERREELLGLLFQTTSTLGVRELEMRRSVLRREERVLDSRFGPLRRKCAEGFGVRRGKWEYEDLRRVALERGLSIAELRAALDLEFPEG